MSFRHWAIVAVAFLLVTAAVLVLADGKGGSRGSTLSRGPGGWLAARRYLEGRGVQVTLITEPVGSYLEKLRQSGEGHGGGDLRARQDLPGDPLRGSAVGTPPAGAGVLVLAFPWQGVKPVDLDQVVGSHLGSGGDLVLAYSGDETDADHGLGLVSWHSAGRVPFGLWRWWSFVHREWVLRPAGARSVAGSEARANGSAGWTPIRIWAPRAWPEPGPGAQVLYTGPGGQPAVWVFRRQRGRVVVLPADALANARLPLAGNADLLEALLLNLGRRWAFDEYHHGLVTTEGGSPALGRTFDLLLGHLVLLYLLAVLALGRRQGPAWHEPVPLAGSAVKFLLGLGALHHRLGHHREAAQQLLRRARELDRALELPPQLERLAATAGPRELVEIAGQVARRRSGHFPTQPGEPR